MGRSAGRRSLCRICRRGDGGLGPAPGSATEFAFARPPLVCFGRRFHHSSYGESNCLATICFRLFRAIGNLVSLSCLPAFPPPFPCGSNPQFRPSPFSLVRFFVVIGGRSLSPCLWASVAVALARKYFHKCIHISPSSFPIINAPDVRGSSQPHLTASLHHTARRRGRSAALESLPNNCFLAIKTDLRV